MSSLTFSIMAERVHAYLRQIPVQGCHLGMSGDGETGCRQSGRQWRQSPPHPGDSWPFPPRKSTSLPSQVIRFYGLLHSKNHVAAVQRSCIVDHRFQAGRLNCLSPPGCPSVYEKAHLNSLAVLYGSGITFAPLASTRRFEVDRAVGISMALISSGDR